MKAHLEPIVYVARIGKNMEKMGDPFEVTCTIQRIGDKGFILGLSKDPDKKFTFAHARALKKALLAHGFTEADWIRIKEDLNG